MFPSFNVIYKDRVQFTITYFDNISDFPTVARITRAMNHQIENAKDHSAGKVITDKSSRGHEVLQSRHGIVRTIRVQRSS